MDLNHPQVGTSNDISSNAPRHSQTTDPHKPVASDKDTLTSDAPVNNNNNNNNNHPEQDVIEDSVTITTQLANIFRNTALYKKLLAYRDAAAQTLLDTFQILLDHDTIHTSFRSNLAVALKRLSLNANLYPQGFELTEIDMDDEPIAGGGFADVYKGDLRGEVVCLKSVRMYEPDQVDHLIKAYSKEAILWRQLSHPNLLPFYGICRVRSRMSFVSPWAENGHILKYLKSNPKTDRVLLCLDTAVGVNYLHDHGIIHGDLKALNVLVDSSGRAVVADFGYSAVSDPEILHWTSHSSAASKGGTVRWQAPELQEDLGDFVVNNTRASDIYALACVYYEIFTEVLPFFEFARDATVITKVFAGKRPSVPAKTHKAWTEWGLSDELWNLMVECWVHDPAERPGIAHIVKWLSVRTPVDVRPLGNWGGRRSDSNNNNAQAGDTGVGADTGAGAGAAGAGAGANGPSHSPAHRRQSLVAAESLLIGIVD